jgi:hypothetical protein
MLGMWQDLNCELVGHFCAMVWLSRNGYDSTINFSIEGHRFSLCIKEIFALFGLANTSIGQSFKIVDRRGEVAYQLELPP